MPTRQRLRLTIDVLVNPLETVFAEEHLRCSVCKLDPNYGIWEMVQYGILHSQL